jgi:hypothetical protein
MILRVSMNTHEARFCETPAFWGSIKRPPPRFDTQLGSSPVHVQSFCLTFLALIVTSVAVAQDNPRDGYAIITSRDTVLGHHECYSPCQADLDCPERQRCIDLPDVGQMCMSLREEDEVPQGWTVCEADLDCAPTDICARKVAPTQIDAFIEHKRARGFAVHLIDETVWGGGTGDDGADNIRAWLQANYLDLNLRYVLLIGDPRPTGDVPMRGSRPANNAHQDWAGNPVVLTDYYFADLDGDWDLDGDGHLAEYSVRAAQIEEGSPASNHRESLDDDMGPGGANRDAELAVGRIPFYGQVAELDHILQKTMNYENAPENNIGWRRSALLAAEGQHRAFFGELIRTEILLPSGYDAYRVYDLEACWDEELNDDVECRSPIDGRPETLICNPTNVEIGVNAIRPGFVSWLTHGSGRGAQAVMLQGNARSLPDDKPFFTFQASCYNGQPTTIDNLAYELLKNGAIGTIGAATISHGPGSPMPSLRDDAGNAGMAYNFAERLIAQGMSAGEALTDLRRTVDVSNRWWYWKNYLTFNLWGDPSIGIGSHAQAPEPTPGDAGVDGGQADMSRDHGLTDAGLTGEDASPTLTDATMNRDADASPTPADATLISDDAQPDAGERESSADGAWDPDEGDVGSHAPMTSGSDGGCMTSANHPGSQMPFLVLWLVLFGLSRRRVSP